MFNCEWSNDNYIELNAVNFAVYVEECPNIAAASRMYPDSCKSISDLVFPSDSCDCPYCKCDTATIQPHVDSVIEYSITQINEGIEEYCYNCTCGLSGDSGIGSQLVYQCDELLQARSPSEIAFFSCPPNTCSGTVRGFSETFSAGDYWWPDVADSSKPCDTICRCSIAGNNECSTGYEDILSTRDNIMQAFIDDCGQNIASV